MNLQSLSIFLSVGLLPEVAAFAGSASTLNAELIFSQCVANDWTRVLPQCGSIHSPYRLQRDITTKLKRDPSSKLNLTTRRRGFGDDAELRRVHETAWRPEVRMVERVEKLGPELNTTAIILLPRCFENG